MADAAQGLEDSDVEVDDRQLGELSLNVKLPDAAPKKRVRRKLTKLHVDSPSKPVIQVTQEPDVSTSPVAPAVSGSPHGSQDGELDLEDAYSEGAAAAREGSDNDGGGDYVDEEDELEVFFAAKSGARSASQALQGKKTKKGKARPTKASNVAAQAAGSKAALPAQHHALEGEEAAGDDEDTAAATQRLLRDEARFDCLGRGFQPEVQPLDSLLTKLAARRATFDPVGAALVTARTACKAADPLALLDSVDALLDRVVHSAAVDVELIIEDDDEAADGGDGEAAAAEGGDEGVAGEGRGGGKEQSAENARAERERKVEEEKAARREKRAARDAERRNAFELLLQAQMCGGGRKAAKSSMPAPVEIARRVDAAPEAVAADARRSAAEPPQLGRPDETAGDDPVPVLQLCLDTQADVMDVSSNPATDGQLQLCLDDTQVDPDAPADAPSAAPPSAALVTQHAESPPAVPPTSAAAGQPGASEAARAVAGERPLVSRGSRLARMTALPFDSQEARSLEGGPAALPPRDPEEPSDGAAEAVDGPGDHAAASSNGGDEDGALGAGDDSRPRDLEHGCGGADGGSPPDEDAVAASAATQPGAQLDASDGCDEGAPQRDGRDGADLDAGGLEDSESDGEDGGDEDGDDEDGDEDEDDSGGEQVDPQAARDAVYLDILRRQRERELGGSADDGARKKKRKLRARDFYEAEAEQSEDEDVSEDEESDDGYDEYEGMSQTEVEDMLRELREKGVGQAEIAQAHAAWADDQDAAAVKKLMRSLKRGFDKGRKRLGGPGDDDDDGDLEDARARRRARLDAEDVDYESIDADTLVREHLKRTLASESAAELRNARRKANLGEDHYLRRASEKEAYQKALASKEVCLPDIEDDDDAVDLTGSAWSSLFGCKSASQPPNVSADGPPAAADAAHAFQDGRHVGDVCSFARDASLGAYSTPSLLGRPVHRSSANVKVASSMVSSFVFLTEGVSQGGSLGGASKSGLAAARRDASRAASNHAAAGEADAGGASSFRGLNDILTKRRADAPGGQSGARPRPSQPGGSSLKALAAGLGSSLRGGSLIDRHLASAVALKKL